MSLNLFRVWDFEARPLASIASVADLHLSSKVEGSRTASLFFKEEITPAALKKGTRIEVTDLSIKHRPAENS